MHFYTSLAQDPIARFVEKKLKVLNFLLFALEMGVLSVF